MIDTFNVLRDPKFVEKLKDIVGLVHVSTRACFGVVLRRKSQIQALDRTQPGLPLKKGRTATLIHDYKRHGTNTLFAALHTLEGSIISRCEQRNRHTGWLDFLRQIERGTPKDQSLHLVCNNYTTHKYPKVKQWLEKHPRFTLHFTPASAS